MESEFHPCPQRQHSAKPGFLREEYHDTSNVKRQRDNVLYMDVDQRPVEYRHGDDRHRQDNRNLERYASIRDFGRPALDGRHHDDIRHDSCHADDRRDHTSTTNLNRRQPYDGHDLDNSREGGDRRLENQRGHTSTTNLNIRNPYDGHHRDNAKESGARRLENQRDHTSTTNLNRRQSHDGHELDNSREIRQCLTMTEILAVFRRGFCESSNS